MSLEKNGQSQRKKYYLQFMSFTIIIWGLLYYNIILVSTEKKNHTFLMKYHTFFMKYLNSGAGTGCVVVSPFEDCIKDSLSTLRLLASGDRIAELLCTSI